MKDKLDEIAKDVSCKWYGTGWPEQKQLQTEIRRAIDEAIAQRISGFTLVPTKDMIKIEGENTDLRCQLDEASKDLSAVRFDFDNLYNRYLEAEADTKRLRSLIHNHDNKYGSPECYRILDEREEAMNDNHYPVRPEGTDTLRAER